LLEHEDWKSLALHIESRLTRYIKDRSINIKVSWSRIHGYSEKESVSPSQLCCRKEDYNEIWNAMLILYGIDKINRDRTRPKMKFVPMPVLKCSPKATSSFIKCQQYFKQNIIYFSLRNICSPSAIIHYKNMEDSKIYDLTMMKILKNFTNEDNCPIFSTVVLHGRKKDTIPSNHAKIYNSFRYNLTKYAQDLLPGLLPSDLHYTVLGQ